MIPASIPIVTAINTAVSGVFASSSPSLGGGGGGGGPALDPKPYIMYGGASGMRYTVNLYLAHDRGDYLDFSPRPEYSQDETDYL